MSLNIFAYSGLLFNVSAEPVFVNNYSSIFNSVLREKNNIIKVSSSEDDKGNYDLYLLYLVNPNL